MERLVDVHPVEQDQVLRRLAPPDEKLSTLIPGRDDAGKRREVRGQIGGDIRRGQPLDIFRPDGLPSGIDVGHAASLLLHHELVELFRIEFQRHRDAAYVVGAEHQRVSIRFIADERDAKLIISRSNSADEVNAIGVRYGAIQRRCRLGIGGRVVERHGCAGERPSIRLVGDETSHGGGLSRRRLRKGGERKHRSQKPGRASDDLGAPSLRVPPLHIYCSFPAERLSALNPRGDYSGA